jgi:uncharacterized membrane protein YpjA
MNWKRRMRRKLLFAVLGGVAFNAVYFGLLFTTSLHGFAVKALGPAIDIVYRYIDPTFSIAGAYRLLYEYAVNILLYTFWIFIVLLVVDVLRRLKRTLAR